MNPLVYRRVVAPLHDLGDGISVRRVLPSPQRLAVGPFVLIDHMGPLTLEPGRHFDVRPHPHIGLATLTYLWEGRVVHRDGLGVEQVIEPGAVNLMHTGSGIVHSERQHDDDRVQPLRVHGLQIWLVPPAERANDAPGFSHTPLSALPRFSPVAGADLCLVAGSAWQRSSPVPVTSPMMYVDARLAIGATIAVPDDHPQRALYVLSGQLALSGPGDPPGTEAGDAPGGEAGTKAVELAGPGELVLLEPGARIELTALEATHVVLLGGAPLDSDWHVWWNFATPSLERLEEAKAGWRERRWPMVAGDESFIPLPAEHERTRITISGHWPDERARAMP